MSENDGRAEKQVAHIVGRRVYALRMVSHLIPSIRDNETEVRNLENFGMFH